MPSTFDKRFTAHSVPMLNREHGIDVVLIRDCLASAPFTVRRGFKESRPVGRDTNLESSQRLYKFLLAADDCVIEGDTVEPRMGMLLETGEMAGGSWQPDELYEIRFIDDAEPAATSHLGGLEWGVRAKKINPANRPTVNVMPKVMT